MEPLWDRYFHGLPVIFPLCYIGKYDKHTHWLSMLIYCRHKILLGTIEGTKFIPKYEMFKRITDAATKFHIVNDHGYRIKIRHRSKSKLGLYFTTKQDTWYYHIHHDKIKPFSVNLTCTKCGSS